MQQTAENPEKNKGNRRCIRSVCFFCNCHIEPGEEISDGEDCYYHRDCHDLLFNIRYRQAEFEK